MHRLGCLCVGARPEADVGFSPTRRRALPLPAQSLLPQHFSLNAGELYQSLLSSQCKVGGSPRMPGKGMTFPQTPAHRLPSAIVRMGCSIFRELGARVFSFPLILMLLPSQGPCARDQQALLVFVFCSFINTQTHYRTYRKC